ncbi:AMP-binding protein [Candidatus Sulfurimonas marisnigri]|uniref:AMP-binding protein n=1 Tax=Candidatus Sulfurimonas marisnigri TaxID=2740405 RepID=A0A7S7RNU1_9BACT|nr:AMP-binding protein [Candidatus Sulfurimonas marisnigri]QOY53652.1 AMP-binding protein [Candidatus Sulfurimonas marisnigri]
MTYPYNNLENFTLHSLLNRSIKLYEYEPSFGMVGEKAMSYSEFMQKINKTIELLRKNGISKGDKVVLLSENMPNWSVAYFAVTYFGGVIVPVLVDFHPSEVHHIIRHSEAKAVFVSDKHISTMEECENTDVEFVIKLDNLRIVDELTTKDYLSQIKQKTKELTQQIYKSANELTKPNEEDLCAIIYTSGTTGHSKGVMLSHKNLVTNAMSMHTKATILKSDVLLSILPLAHTFECTVGLIVPVLHGCSVYYIDKAPTPSVLIKSFDIVKPTIIISVPLIIEKIYKNKILPNFTNSCIVKNLYKASFVRKKLNKIAGKKLIKKFGGKLRLFAIGGAALSPSVEKFLIEAEFPYLVGYGLTETSPMLAASALGETIKLKSTGTVMAGVELKIKNQNSDTGEGEILALSPSIMMGYYKDEEKSKEIMEDGWLLTGDLGYIDKDGFLFISGRSKNVIIGSGGKNIYPEQIEAVINQNEAVLDSLVMEQRSQLIAKIHLNYEFLDKKFKAYNTSDTKAADDIANFLEEMRIDVNSQVSSFSRIIKFIEQRDPFIKTPTKKIKRYIYEN